jgi:small subunit ribosomal protein S17
MSSKVLNVKVVSVAGNKTIVALHTFLKQHPIYGKYVKKQKKYMVHDENNSAKVGDSILIAETKPISKRKSWTIINKESSVEGK